MVVRRQVALVGKGERCCGRSYQASEALCLFGLVEQRQENRSTSELIWSLAGEPPLGDEGSSPTRFGEVILGQLKPFHRPVDQAGEFDGVFVRRPLRRIELFDQFRQGLVRQILSHGTFLGKYL